MTPPGEGERTKKRRQEPWHRRFVQAASEKAQEAQKNWQLYSFLLALATVNLVVFVVRATQFIGMKDANGNSPNYFYMISRQDCFSWPPDREKFP